MYILRDLDERIAFSISIRLRILEKLNLEFVPIVGRHHTLRDRIQLQLEQRRGRRRGCHEDGARGERYLAEISARRGNFFFFDFQVEEIFAKGGDFLHVVLAEAVEAREGVVRQAEEKRVAAAEERVVERLKRIFRELLQHAGVAPTPIALVAAAPLEAGGVDAEEAEGAAVESDAAERKRHFV